MMPIGVALIGASVLVVAWPHIAKLLPPTPGSASLDQRIDAYKLLRDEMDDVDSATFDVLFLKILSAKK